MIELRRQRQTLIKVQRWKTSNHIIMAATTDIDQSTEMINLKSYYNGGNDRHWSKYRDVKPHNDMNCGKLAFDHGFDTSRRAQLFATDSEYITFKSSSFSWDAQAPETVTCLRYLCHPFELALRVPLFAKLVLDSLMRPMSAFSRTAGRERRRHSTWRAKSYLSILIFSSIRMDSKDPCARLPWSSSPYQVVRAFKPHQTWATRTTILAQRCLLCHVFLSWYFYSQPYMKTTGDRARASACKVSHNLSWHF
jgi:hypothetical protein